ncbi:MAG: pectate lyase [Prevotella sp.]|nr:pectate lyase [Prevotella sp.]
MKRLTLLSLLSVCLYLQAQVPFADGKVINRPIRELTFPDDSVRLSLADERDTTILRSDFEVRFAGIEILEAQGWLESAYAKFVKYPGAKAYHAYVRREGDGDYVRLDNQLVRDYDVYGRVDAVGLPAGDYRLRIVPVDSDGVEISLAASETDILSVAPHDRAGFAHKNHQQGVGAYTDDGRLKPGAEVIYVTSATARTVSARLSSGTYTGIQSILTAYEKGNVTTPLAVRIIGKVNASDVDSFGSSAEGLQVKGRKADSELNITIEGIGDDATVYGFGFLVRNVKSLEMRNFAIMQCMDDGISLDTDNSNIWIHHIDVFYGRNKGGDQKKGDGAIDVKSDSKFVTIDNCHFWDTGKSSMCGMKSESGPNYITYHHNWFDHSDSRHARVRTMSVHMYNNYFDQVAKYGVGATSGSSIFMERNYFAGTKKPILSSLQGTDALGSGTFSGEDGGMVKAFGNHFDHQAKNFRYHTQASPAATGYDAYETATRDEQVPASEVTRVGGTAYDNFDTDASLMYDYAPDDAADVPAKVTGRLGAGRMNHGDFQYAFKDNIGDDDADSELDTALEGLIKNYESRFIGFFGQPASTDDDSDTTSVTPHVGDVILCSFDKNGTPSSDFFTVIGNGSNSKGEITVDGVTYTTCLKIESSTRILFTLTEPMRMTLYFGPSETASIKIDGTKITGATGNIYSTTLPAGPHELTKDKSVNLFLIKLEIAE